MLSRSELCRSTFACSPVSRFLSTYWWALGSNELATLLTACLVTARACSSSLLVWMSVLLCDHYVHYFHHGEHHQWPPDECWCLSSPSDYTTASLCISDDCFLCAHVALNPIETPPNRTPNKLSSFKWASNFVCDVQHVSGVEWSPSGIVLSVSNKDIWNHDVFGWTPLSLSRSFQTIRRRICKVWSKWSKNINVGDWTYLDLWKLIRKSPLQLHDKGKYLLINCLKRVVLAECYGQVLTVTHRCVHGGHVDWFGINNWRVWNCCVTSSLPGKVVVESITNWDYLIGSNVSTIWHGYHTSIPRTGFVLHNFNFWCTISFRVDSSRSFGFTLSSHKVPAILTYVLYYNLCCCCCWTIVCRLFLKYHLRYRQRHSTWWWRRWQWTEHKHR